MQTNIKFGVSFEIRVIILKMLRNRKILDAKNLNQGRDKLLHHVGVSCCTLYSITVLQYNSALSTVWSSQTWTNVYMCLRGSVGVCVCHFVFVCLCCFFVFAPNAYTGWPKNNGTAYWGIISWGKLYQDQQYWSRDSYSRVHYIRRCRVLKKNPFSAKSWLGISALRLAIIVSTNPIIRLCQWAFFTPVVIYLNYRTYAVPLFWGHPVYEHCIYTFISIAVLKETIRTSVSFRNA